MVRAALMRLLRRRVKIITLAVLLAAPIAVAQGAASPRDAAEPWATVNVCDSAQAPDTIGIRASMPGARSREELYMRFVVQYLSAVDGRWRRVGAGGDSGYLYVGKGRRPRQFGRSFRLDPGAAPVLLRGVVSFQWRVGDDVVRRARARTTRGHRSSAGADPPGYSAATCTISLRTRTTADRSRSRP